MLLRRLAPSIRHHLVVNLQPIGMIYEVLDRRLSAPVPKLADVHESAGKINGFARAALDSSLQVVSWLAPEEGAAVTVVAGVQECLGLLTTSFSFRGFALRNEVGQQLGEVPRCALRSVLTAALIHAADKLPPPGDLILSCETTSDGVVLMLDLNRTQGGHGFTQEPTYRDIEWADLQALARAESVTLEREGDTRIRVSIPWMAARAT